MRLVRGVSVRHEDLDAQCAKGCPELGIRQLGRFLNERGSTNDVGERSDPKLPWQEHIHDRAYRFSTTTWSGRSPSVGALKNYPYSLEQAFYTGC